MQHSWFGKNRRDFHSRSTPKFVSNAVRSKIWESQNLRGCAPNQIWHPIERKCFAFCGYGKDDTLGMVADMHGSMNCVLEAQDFAGQVKCQSSSYSPVPSDHHSSVPPSRCRDLCAAIFPRHPACFISDPSTTTILKDDDIFFHIQYNQLSIRFVQNSSRHRLTKLNTFSLM